MQNNDLIGKVVLSRAGRDIDHVYVIIKQIDKDYVLLADGDAKSFNNPKRKKVKHLKTLENVDEHLLTSIQNGDKNTDLKIKRFLKVRGIVKEG